MKISPALNGFIKGLLLVVLTAAVSYFDNSANLAPVFGDTLALVIAGLASAIESSIKASSGRGLFGITLVR